MSAPLSVCYFGAYRRNYPRNLIIRKALALGGVPVAECCVPPRWPSWRRWPALAWQFLRQPDARTAPVVFVAEFCHTVVPLAWALSRSTGAALVFDPGISFHDEMVFCQRTVTERSMRARYLRGVDAAAFRLADMVVWFTPVDEEHFGRAYKIPPRRSGWLPPGVDDQLFARTAAPDSALPFVVHWDGSFIASHGVEVILDAASLLRDRPDIRFELVGDGPLAESMRGRAQAVGLRNVAFMGSVSAEELAASVRRAHVCLGAFRADDKQRRSLYTKELQAMLAGRPVVTADGEAKRRAFVPGQDILLVSPENPHALAEAIVALQADPGQRQRLAESGHAAVRALCTPDALRPRLDEIIRRALQARRSGTVGQKVAGPL